MKAKHALQNVLTKFAKNVDHNPHNVPPTGYTHIIINDNTTMQIDFDEEKESVTLIAPIAPNNPDIYADLLVLNTFRDQLAGGRFILLRETNQIALLTHFDLTNLTSQKFELLFKEFIDVTNNWAEMFGSKYTNKNNNNDAVPALIYNDIFNRA